MKKFVIDGKEIKPFETFICVENEKFERYILEINKNGNKVPIYIRPSDIKKLKMEL